MTKEELAALINGREYRQELTKAEAAQAKAAGLLVIYGASDDLLEFDGAFSDEVGAYNGTTAMIHASGVLPSWEALDKEEMQDVKQWFADWEKARHVTALWDSDDYSWVIWTDVPHAQFDIVEDGEKYCRGVVLAVSDLSD